MPDRLTGARAALVLVTDDDPVTRLLITQVLEADGFLTDEAGTGSEAVERMRTHKPDLIVVEMVIGEAGTCETCAEIRRMPGLADLPILVLADDDGAALDRALEAGATDFAARPIAPAMLVHRVRQMLQSRRGIDDLRRSEARLAWTQTIAKIGHWAYDADTDRLLVSAAAAKRMGLPRRGMTLARFFEALPDDDAVRVANEISGALVTGTPFGLDHRFRSADGDIVLHTRATAIREGDVVKGLAGTMQDVTERVAAEEKVRALAFYDTLTGLPNRVLFTDLLKAALSRARRHRQNVAVMFLDLDGFKNINDTLGHRAGDRVLEKVAARLRQVTRDYDAISREGEVGPSLAIGRLGGDEFLLAITDLEEPGDAAVVAGRIVAALRLPILTEDGEILVSGSVGVSVYPQDGDDVDELLKNADTALYHAKDRGRNTYEFYSPQLSAATLDRVVLEKKLRTAVEKHGFTLHYQPQFDAAAGRIIGAEALLRWQDPDRGIVGPAGFMEVLESTGLIRDILPWIVETAASQLRLWQDAGLEGLRMAINLSGEQLQQPEVAESIDRIVAACGVDPQFVEFEITESVLIGQGSGGVAAVGALKGRGYRIALDDFGTGYSSLSYLTRFPFDCLKIDRSFTDELLANATQAAIIESIIQLARRLDIDLIAEGVERTEQRDRLLLQGCTRMQGFLFGKPMPPGSFFALAIGLRDG
jgi:diguanylate cyclase (GGDEF)-like protein/PAS domain S-box-containing protein